MNIDGERTTDLANPMRVLLDAGEVGSAVLLSSRQKSQPIYVKATKTEFPS
jgi:hypothetical protein